MKYIVCDRCNVEYTNDDGDGIVLKDSVNKGKNTLNFKITLGIQASQQIITPIGSENVCADICPNCAVRLLIKDVMKNLDYNKDS